jgi:hypothetical protein
MFAKVENNQVVAANSSKDFFKGSTGIYEVIYDTTNLKDTEFYYNGAETFTFANDQVTASYAPATAKALEDVNEVDINGQPLLDKTANKL